MNVVTESTKLTPEQWFARAMEDARIAFMEGFSNDQEFYRDCAEIAQQYVDMICPRR